MPYEKCRPADIKIDLDFSDRKNQAAQVLRIRGLIALQKLELTRELLGGNDRHMPAPRDARRNAAIGRHHRPATAARDALDDEVVRLRAAAEDPRSRPPSVFANEAGSGPIEEADDPRPFRPRK